MSSLTADLDTASDAAPTPRLYSRATDDLSLHLLPCAKGCTAVSAVLALHSQVAA